MYKTLQRDVNIHYFPSTHLLSPWREGDSLLQVAIADTELQVGAHLTYQGPQREATEWKDNSSTADRSRLPKVEFPGEIGTDF